MFKKLLSSIVLAGTILIGYSTSSNAQSVDITERGGYIATSFEGNSNFGEAAGKLIDNNTGTKVFAGSGNGGTITFLGDVAQVATGYSVTSANDANDRDWKAWKFEGSNDGVTWTTLDEQSNQAFPFRFQTLVYTFANTTAYKYYHWSNITRKGSGGSNMQVAELEILCATGNGPLNLMIGGKTTDQYGESDSGAATDSYIWAASADNTVAAKDGGTKYTTTNAVTWLKFQGKFKTKALSYSITSGNVANTQTEDPKDWTVYGSLTGNDGDWVKLDAQTGQAFTGRCQTKTYAFSNTEFYIYYKLDVTANNGAASTTIADWQMDGETITPTAPSAFAATSATNNSVTLNWNDNSTNEDGFMIELSKDKANWYRADTAAANSTSYTFNMLAKNVKYFFRITALNFTYGNSGTSKEEVSMRTINDANPIYANITELNGILSEIFNASGGEGRYCLLDLNPNTKWSETGIESLGVETPIWVQWYADKPAVVDKYDLYSSNDGYYGDPKNWTLEATNDTSKITGSWTVLDTRTDFAWTEFKQKQSFTCNSADGKEYHYFRLVITASQSYKDNDHAQPAASSNVALGDWALFGTSLGYGALTMPTGLEATLATGYVNRADLTWADNTLEETGYIVEITADGGITWEEKAKLDVNTTEYTLDNLDMNTEYLIRVAAINADGASYSENVTLLTLSPDIQTPVVFAAEGFSTKSMVVSWEDNSAGEGYFDIQRSTDASMTSPVSLVAESNATYYIDTALAVGTKYYYKIRAASEVYTSSKFTAVFSGTTQLDLGATLTFLDTLKGVYATTPVSGFNNEGIDKVLDNNPKTKYCAPDQDPPVLVTVIFPNHDVNVTGYTVTSANDSPDRDPFEWTLEGSNNPLDSTLAVWDVVDDHSDLARSQTFVARYQDKQFLIKNTNYYKAYRLNINSMLTAGKHMLQFAGLGLYGNHRPGGTGTDVETVTSVPRVFAISQNYPNPFNPTTNFNFTVEKSGHAVVKVYNILGAEVATLFAGQADAGKMYKVAFDASRFASGIYLTRFESGAKSMTKKIVLLK